MNQQYRPHSSYAYWPAMAGAVARIKARMGPRMMYFDGRAYLYLKRKTPQRRNVATMTKLEVTSWKKTYEIISE